MPLIDALQTLVPLFYDSTLELLNISSLIKSRAAYNRHVIGWRQYMVDCILHTVLIWWSFAIQAVVMHFIACPHHTHSPLTEQFMHLSVCPSIAAGIVSYCCRWNCFIAGEHPSFYIVFSGLKRCYESQIGSSLTGHKNSCRVRKVSRFTPVHIILINNDTLFLLTFNNN